MYTDGGIKVVFQEYEIGPYAMVRPVITIPSIVYK
ncbi:RsiV family protein [Bacillus lumedeiriae]